MPRGVTKMYNELKKAPRIIIIMLFIGIIGTIVSSSLTFSSTENSRIVAEEYFTEYHKDSDRFDEKYHDYTYATDEYSFITDIDYIGWKQVDNSRKYAIGFSNNIDLLLFHAKVAQSEVPVNSYLYKYQQQVIDTYSVINENVDVGVNNVYGWSNYFDYNYDEYILILCVLFFTVYIFSSDNKSIPVLRTSGKCYSVVLQKLAFTSIFNGLFSILISITTLTLFQICVNPVGGNFDIQHIPQFELCPMVISIWNFAVFKILIQVIGVCVFSICIGFITLIFSNTKISLVTCLAATLCLWGVNNQFVATENDLIRILNPISWINNCNLFTRYFSIKFFAPVYGVVIGIIFQVIIYLLISTLIFIVFYASFRLKRTCKVTFSTNKNKSNYSNGLFIFELHKLISKRAVVLLIVGFTVIKALFTFCNFNSQYSNDVLFKSYIEKYNGEITDETAIELATEKERLDSILALKESVQNEFHSNEINSEEYRLYMSEYWNAYMSQEAFVQLVDYYDSIKINSGSHIVYDKGYSIFIESFWDYCLLLSLMMIMLLIFAEDSLSGMDSLINTTTNGRNRTLLVKYLLMIVSSIVLCITYEAFNLYVLDCFYGFPYIDAPMSSIRNAPTFISNISIRWGIVILSMIKTFVYTSIVIVFSSLICLLKHCNNNRYYIKKRRSKIIIK
jgi:hypothetical protein